MKKSNVLNWVLVVLVGLVCMTGWLVLTTGSRQDVVDAFKKPFISAYSKVESEGAEMQKTYFNNLNPYDDEVNKVGDPSEIQNQVTTLNAGAKKPLFPGDRIEVETLSFEGGAYTVKMGDVKGSDILTFTNNVTTTDDSNVPYVRAIWNEGTEDENPHWENAVLYLPAKTK